MRGRERRQFFNTLSSTIVLASGLTGALLGYSWFGFWGGCLGLSIGIAAGGSVAGKGRFYRP
jgi:hypothetical protein